MDAATSTANWLWLATSTLSFLLVLNEWFAWSSCKSNSLIQAIYYYFCPHAVPASPVTTSQSGASLASLGVLPVIHVMN